MEKESVKGHPHASTMYQVSGQNYLPYELKIMRGCASFQIKVQIFAVDDILTLSSQNPWVF